MKTNHRYNLLKSQRSQAVYNTILDSVKNFETNISINSFRMNDIVQIYYDVYRDYPELFYLPSQIGYGQTFGKTFIQVNYIYSRSEIAKRNNIINGCIAEIKALVANKYDDFEKVNLVIEYIARKTSYAIDHKYNQNASAVFCDNIAQCSGYSKALQLALESINIPVIYVEGKSNKQNHAWNIVKINDKYYHVDVTYLDGINNNSDDFRIKQYLFYSDDMMEKDHQWDRKNYPICDDISLCNKLRKINNQNNNNMKIFINLNDLRLFIIDSLKKGLTQVEFILQLSNDLTQTEKKRYFENTMKRAFNEANIPVRVSYSIGEYCQIKFEYL